MSIPTSEALTRIYGESEESSKRFVSLLEGFKREFSSDDAVFFTAPGRTEIIGNHTDHNGGRVIAASISLDTIGAARNNGTNMVSVVSEGYRPIHIDISKLSDVPKESGTLSLIAGLLSGAVKFGYKIGGFDVYASTTVIAAAGVSSSASFEMLLCAVINEFFNDGKIPVSDYARMGQYAENVFWNKASGLMDQMACAVGGAIELDFSGDIKYKQIGFDLSGMGYHMVITNTGKGHADLSADYSAVPEEMFSVAKALGRERLCEVSLDEYMDAISRISEEIKNDRALMRAFHFLTENERVKAMSDAISTGDIEQIKALLTASGNSSWKYLQNCYPFGDYHEQRICLALAISEVYLSALGDGCCRVHGGGFAGVIQTIIPKENVGEYVELMAKTFGRENVYPMQIRSVGAVKIAEFLK